jgi:ferredoxin
MPRKRPDERDIIFSRMEMNEEDQKAYYKTHPERKEVDDEMRAMPWERPVGDSMGYKLYDALLDSCYDVQNIIIEHANNSKPHNNPIVDDAHRLTQALYDIMPMLGALDWGIAKIDNNNYYSHHGRGKDKNKPIEASMPYAIVYLTAMDKDMVNRAPRYESMVATLRGYTDVALIGFQLASYINRVGYNADHNMSGYYTTVMPPLGEMAGLGSLGRHGLMVTKKWGSRVRLGAVLTDMPLVPNVGKAFDITPFCEKCGLCAKCCPGKAIDKGSRPVDGWRINDTDCYRIWRAVGTDCGICLSACPLSQGVDSKYLDDIENTDVIDEILRVHKEKYGVRKYIKDELNFLKD